MSKSIKCIMADIYMNEDGLMDCPWLVPYFGDMTEEEYHAAGTALSVRRGCEYCMKWLEFKTMVQEEDLKNIGYIAQAKHPDWPGEVVNVNEYVTSTGGIAGYECQQEMYKTLHDIEAAGWELRCFTRGKEIYRMESEKGKDMRNCGLPNGYEYKCCLNRSGMCTLDTADFNEIDRAVEMHHCGFIGVNDRYLIWKYGVPYKNHNCGHCQYYDGEAHGICTNEEVEPHTQGVTLNGVKTYIDSKEYYSGASACKEFRRKEAEELANTYYTKCGREFKKSTNAGVTGYLLPEGDKECENCPFQIKVTEGYSNPVFKRWECRAESKPPNKTDDYNGSTTDKLTISIRSLHNEFLELVLEYCKAQPDLNASYNQDLEDCRRVISVSCSPNKKGIAAKKALIEKFFPVDKVDEEQTETETCEACVYGIDFGESVEYIKCQEGKNNKDVKKSQPACKKFISCDSEFDDEPEGDLEEQLQELLNDGDHEEKALADKELLSSLIGKEIRTHYDTGGIVFNVSGPYNSYGLGSWTINYTKDGKKSNSPSIINSIKVENGVITCEGEPLKIIEPEDNSEEQLEELLEEEIETRCPYFKGVKKGTTSKYYNKCEALPESLPNEFLGYEDKATANNCSQKCRTSKDLNMCRFYNERQRVESHSCQECGLFGDKNEHGFECKHIYPTNKTGITIPSNKGCEFFIEKEASQYEEETYIYRTLV